MKSFSVYNYYNLHDYQKITFNKALAKKLSSLLNEIKTDDVLDTSAIVEFVASVGESSNSVSVVSNLYSSASGSIQVGSGNQQLFHGILSVITECWNEINK